MLNLLNASFRRIKTSKEFWVCAIVCIGFALFIGIFTLNEYIGMDYVKPAKDSSLLLIALLIPFLFAVFTPFYIGTDYSDGTIRNKLIVGHSRTTVYLSNLIVTTVVSVGLFLATMLCAYASIYIFRGYLKFDGATMIKYIGIMVAMCICFASINTMISMLIQSKPLSVILCFALVLVMFIIVMVISQTLMAPEYYTDYLTGELIRNNSYIDGGLRTFLQFIVDFLPMGQSYQYSVFGEVDKPWIFPVYSLAITAATTGGGLLLFRIKDIK